MENQNLTDTEIKNMINLASAINAHRGTSFCPEKRGEQMRDDFLARAKSFIESAQKIAPNMWDRIEYSIGVMAGLYNAYLQKRSRVLSPMITGPAKFPVSRNEKAIVSEQKAYDLYWNFYSKALRNLKRRFGSPDVITQGSTNELENLQEKLNGLLKTQERYKLINKAHKEFLKRPESLESYGFDDETKNQIKNFTPKYSWEPHPIPPFALTNLNARIRDTKGRLEAAKQRKTLENVEIVINTGKIVVDYQAARIKVFFPGKPEKPVREKLKSNGFRWSPTNECWQAYIRKDKLDFAKQILN